MKLSPRALATAHSCCGKMTFSCERHARKALKAYRRAGRVHRYYQCPEGNWHLTHYTERAWEARNGD